MHVCRLQLLFFYPKKLRNDPKDGDLRHEMLSFVLGGIDVDQGLAVVKLIELLVRIHPDLLEDLHVVVILDHLVMRAA